MAYTAQCNVEDWTARLERRVLGGSDPTAYIKIELQHGGRLIRIEEMWNVFTVTIYQVGKTFGRRLAKLLHANAPMSETEVNALLRFFCSNSEQEAAEHFTVQRLMTRLDMPGKDTTE